MNRDLRLEGFLPWMLRLPWWVALLVTILLAPIQLIASLVWEGVSEVGETMRIHVRSARRIWEVRRRWSARSLHD